MIKDKTLIFIPTYNEKENVVKICEEILDLELDLDILFIDDNSLDGTGVIIDELSEKYTNVKVLHRPKKLGIGSAHLDGINWAYEKGYKKLITMDCDFSHSPKYIPEILKESESYEIVVGSRYLLKNSLEEWSIFRKLLTRIGHFLTKTLLRMRYDATNALRLYQIDKIPQYIFKIANSRGYSFFFQSLYILHLNGLSIKEIPINLPSRTYGHSKMSFKEIIRSTNLLVYMCLTTLTKKEKFKVCEPFNIHSDNLTEKDKQGWNEYWESPKKSLGAVVYRIIAAFYRVFIIKPSVNYFIKKYFPRGANLLHAGCGSGQVDIDICNYVSITALDISIKALNIYKKVNKNNCKLIHGSIFNMPLGNEVFDGIYNLGVMEHFTEEEIKKILSEFRRVLKPGGKIMLFWPPEFGLSVIFLKIVKFILEKIFGKRNVKLHPDEITRLKSKRHIKNLITKTNFSLIECYFGIRDLFTHYVIVAEKRW